MSNTPTPSTNGTSSVRAVSIKRIQPREPSASPTTTTATSTLSVSDPIQSAKASQRKVKLIGTQSSGTPKSSAKSNMFDGMEDEAEEEKDASGTESKRPRKKISTLTAASLDDNPTRASPNSAGAHSNGIVSERAPHRHVVAKPNSKSAITSPVFGKASNVAHAPSMALDELKPTTSSATTSLKHKHSSNQVADAEAILPVTPKLKPADEGEEDEFSKRFGNKGGPLGLHSSALRGARMDDGTGLDPSYQEMVQNNPLHWADPDFAKSHADQTFNHYTSHQHPTGKHGATHIDNLGLTKLANDVVERFLQRYRDLMKRTNPKFNDQQVEKAVMKELPHTFIGAGLKDLPAIKTHVLHYLKIHLHHHATGAAKPVPHKPGDKHHHDSHQVSKMDFIMTWKTVVTTLNLLPKVTKDICVIL